MMKYAVCQLHEILHIIRIVWLCGNYEVTNEIVAVQ